MKDTVERNKYYHCLEYDHEQEGELFLVACGMEQCNPGVIYGPELRDCFHLHAILSGKGTLEAGGQIFHPHIGQMFLLKDNEIVRYTADEQTPWNYCWVTYNGTRARELSEMIGFTDGVYCLDSAVEAKDFYNLVCRMHEEPEMNYINDLRRQGILLEYLSLALKATKDNSKKREMIRTYSMDEYMEKALQFIRYNFATIDVSDVVSYIGFSRSYFSTQFKKYYGMSPQEYIKQRRLQNAKGLLETTDYQIGVVAEQSGYEDQLHFSKAFRKEFGVSPTEYRKRAIEDMQKTVSDGKDGAN